MLGRLLLDLVYNLTLKTQDGLHKRDPIEPIEAKLISSLLLKTVFNLISHGWPARDLKLK